MTNQKRNSPGKFSIVACLLALSASMTPLPAAADGFTLTGSMTEARYGASDILLTSGTNSGRVLIAGGFNGAADVATAVLWNPATGQFSAAANGLSAPRGFMSVTPLAGTGAKILFANGG